MNEVDHIIPFNGHDDPLRLMWENLMSLCRQCHALKTSRCDTHPRMRQAQHRFASGVTFDEVIKDVRRLVTEQLA